MKFTNKLNLPAAVVAAVSNDSYDRAESFRTVTELIAPPRQVVLRKKHDHEIEEDVSERLYALFGQLVHGLLDRADEEGVLKEKRLFLELQGKLISGQLDSFKIESGHLIDYKYSTAWKAKGERPAEWVEQINLIAVLLREAGYTVNTAEVVLFMRDHSKLEAKRDPEYPQLPFARLPIPLFASDRARAFMEKRVALHLAAEAELPECSFEDRWAKPDLYAVKKPGAERATKLHYTPEDAAEHVARDPKLVVEKRPGQNVRCESYCSAAPFCAQYQKIKNGDSNE